MELVLYLLVGLTLIAGMLRANSSFALMPRSYAHSSCSKSLVVVSVGQCLLPWNMASTCLVNQWSWSIVYRFPISCLMNCWDSRWSYVQLSDSPSWTYARYHLPHCTTLLSWTQCTFRGLSPATWGTWCSEGSARRVVDHVTNCGCHHSQLTCGQAPRYPKIDVLTS